MSIAVLSFIASFVMFVRYHSSHCGDARCDGLPVGIGVTLAAGLTLGLVGAGTTVGARIRGRIQVRRINRQIEYLRYTQSVRATAGGGS